MAVIAAIPAATTYTDVVKWVLMRATMTIISEGCPNTASPRRQKNAGFRPSTLSGSMADG
jgi:hypothetical protein